MLSFKDTKKKVMPVEFRDGTVISVYMPTKMMFDNLTAIDMDELKEESASEMYRLIAGLISRNAENKEITAEYLENTLDFEDLKLLFNAYAEFVNGVLHNPN